MPNTSSQVSLRIQKLLNLASCPEATLAELNSAMRKAAELAIKHNLDLAKISSLKISSKANFQIERRFLKAKTRDVQRYHFSIGYVFNAVFGVKTLFTKSNCGDCARVTLIGTPGDIETCSHLFPWLETVFVKLCRSAIQRNRIRATSPAKRCFFDGLYFGIIEVNKQQKEQLKSQDRDAYALVVADKEAAIASFMQKEQPDVRTVKRRKAAQDSTAMFEGYKEGRKLHLSQMGATDRAALPSH